MVRLLHTSDTHLGHQQYARTDPRTGLNQREQDHYDAWDALIDRAVADPPDLFIHAGDLFDGVRPSNRALAAAMEGLLRLSRAGIETVLIAGNHETPKMRGTGSPFRLFEHLQHIHPVYKGRHETMHLAGATVHAVPQCADHETLRTEVAALQRGPGANIIVLHGSVHTLEAFRHAEFNEQSLDASWFDERFDYVALGHYHVSTQVSPRAWYCGAPDRVSIAESGQQKGFLRVHMEASVAGAPSGATPEVRFEALPVRPYLDLPPIDASGLDAADVMQACRDALARVPEGAVTRLVVTGAAANLRGAIDQRALRFECPGIHLELRIEWDDVDRLVHGDAEFGPLESEFQAFVGNQVLEGVDRQRIVAMATTLLREAA